MDRVLVSHLSVWFALFVFCAQNAIDSRKLVSVLMRVSQEMNGNANHQKMSFYRKNRSYICVLWSFVVIIVFECCGERHVSWFYL